MTSTLTLSNVESIANTLVEKCRRFEFDAVTRELYSPDIVSIESMEMPEFPREVKGLQAVLEKGKRWAENTEVHHMEISDPLVAGSQFAVKFTMDMTCKQTGQRNVLQEIGLYQVADGKIVREQFFYDACQQ